MRTEKAVGQAEHVKAWRDSGESASIYCEREGIELSKLRYWASRIPRRDKPKKGKPKAVQGVRLAKVRRTAPKTAAKGECGIGLLLGGVRVEVGQDFDAATLSRVLDVLSSREAGR